MTGINMTVAADTGSGYPVAELIRGGTHIEIWPTGKPGILLTMPVADWHALVHYVQSTLPEGAA